MGHVRRPSVGGTLAGARSASWTVRRRRWLANRQIDVIRASSSSSSLGGVQSGRAIDNAILSGPYPVRLTCKQMAFKEVYT